MKKVSFMKKINQISISLKPVVVFLFSLVSVGLFVASTLFATAACGRYDGLVLGIILMLAAIPLQHWGSKTQIGYILSFFVNSVANGFSVSAYYNSKGIEINSTDMLRACVLPIVLLFIVYIIVQFFPKTKKYACIGAVALCFVALVVLLVLWIRHKAPLYSFGFFAVLLSLFYHCVAGVTVNNSRLVLRDISFGSFGAFIVISLVVLFIITEGEILEGFDISSGSGKKPKHRKSKK